MGAHRFRSTWRSLTFNAKFDDTGITDDPTHVVAANTVAGGALAQYDLDELDLSPISSQDYRELRQYLEGAEGNEAYEGVRSVVGSGIIQSASAGDLEDASWVLNEQFSIAACRLAAVGLTPPGVLPFDFKRAITGGGSKALRVYARPAMSRPIIVGKRREGTIRPFRFALVSFDPFVYDVAATNTALGNLAGGANAVTNPGNMYTYPTITVTFSGAGAALVTLTNTTTGQVLTFDLSGFAAGNVLTIDTKRSRMTDATGANRMAAILTGFLSQFFLLPGANNITWSVNTGLTSVSFGFRGAYA